MEPAQFLNRRYSPTVVVDERTSRNLWSRSRVIDITPDSMGVVRSVKVKTATSPLERSILKLVLLLENS